MVATERQVEARPAPQELPEIELIFEEAVSAPPEKKARSEAAAKGAQTSKDRSEREEKGSFRIPRSQGGARGSDRASSPTPGRKRRDTREERELRESGWISSGRGRALSSTITGVEGAQGARRLASTVNVPSSSTLSKASTSSVWIAGTDVTIHTHPSPVLPPVVSSSSSTSAPTPAVAVSTPAPAVSFGSMDIRLNPARMAELEQQMREKAKKASQYISKTAQRRQKKPKTSVSAPVCGVQAGPKVRDVSSRAEAAPRAADRPQGEPKVVLESLPTMAAKPLKSALRKTSSSTQPEKKRTRDVDITVKYVKASELPTSISQPLKGRVRFIGMEPKETSVAATEVMETAQPALTVTVSMAEEVDTTVRPLAAAATRYVPPPLPPGMSEPMLKCMAHLAGTEINPDRVKPLSVRVAIPIATADFCQHHLAFKVLDVLERPASLPADREAWLDYLTEEIVGTQDLTGVYAMTRISVGAMLALHEMMTAGAELRRHYRDSSVSLPMKEMLQGLAPGDTGVSTVMSRERLENFLGTALYVEHPQMEFGLRWTISLIANGAGDSHSAGSCCGGTGEAFNFKVDGRRATGGSCSSARRYIGPDA